MKRQIRINNIADIDKIKEALVNAAENTRKKLLELCSNKSGVDVLYDMKFLQSGRDPIEDRDLNIIEQLNQQFTYLVSLEATRYLITEHPREVPFIMNLGNVAGIDIISESKKVVAEVFSAADPRNNNKIKKDAEKVYKLSSDYKYVFYHSPQRYSGETRLTEQFPGVRIIHLDIKK